MPVQQTYPSPCWFAPLLHCCYHVCIVVTLLRPCFSCLTVGHNKLTPAQVVENVLSIIDQLATELPGGHANIKNIYVKGANTKALPVYFNLGKHIRKLIFQFDSLAATFLLVFFFQVFGLLKNTYMYEN